VPDDKQELDYLDYTSIRFPSDNLTLGVVRKLEPDKFDVNDAPNDHINDGYDGCSSWEKVQAVMQAERWLARFVYEEAMGRDPEKAIGGYPCEKADFVDGLMELYPEYGLASGAVAALELIKDIERQAVEQAKAYGKGPPGRP
jgi:hypothetical protein